MKKDRVNSAPSAFGAHTGLGAISRRRIGHLNPRGFGALACRGVGRRRPSTG